MKRLVLTLAILATFALGGVAQQGELVITPDTLTFEEPWVSQTFTISNQTNNAVTISSINVEPDDNVVLLSGPGLPRTLQPNGTMNVEVYVNGIGYKGYLTYYINVATSIGNRQVTVRVDEEAWDEGLLWMPMQGLTFDENSPLTQGFNLINTNALQSITIYELYEDGTDYLELVPSHSLPYVIPPHESLYIDVTLVNFPENTTNAYIYSSSSLGQGSSPYVHIAGGLSTPYHPIVEDGKQWNVLFSYPWSPPEPQHKYTDIYKIEGDTLLDGVSYKVMYATRNENLTGWNLWGFLRETEDGQVFSRRPSASDEQLLYDFSMQVGDTIIMNGNGFYPDQMFVVETNEILIGGEPRKQIVLEYPWGAQEIWIEGIGSLYGIIDSGSLFLTGGSTDLLCYYEDGDLIWQNTTPGYNECYIVNTGQQNGLVVAPTTLTFDEPAVPQSFIIYNHTDNAVTITDINVQPDDNMVLLDYSDLPRTLQPDETMNVSVVVNSLGYKGYNTYYVNVATSVGNRQVIVRVNEEAWDEGLQYIPMQGITFDENTPLTQSFYLQNTNALQSITVYEISEYGTNYLEMVPSHSLPYEIPAGGFLEVAVTLVNFPEEQTVTRVYCRSSQGEGAGYFFFIAGGLSNGGNGVHSLWKPINLPGTLLGVNAQGYMFSTNYDSPQSLMRSHDDGETWETVLNGSIGNLTISNEGRIFVFSHNTMTVMYSDDNGDTWQQTNQISPCGMIDTPRLFATTNDIIVGWAQNGEIFWTLDGGDTWNGTILEFMEEHQEISDLLVSENGDVYVSVWYYIGPNIGVYHSILSDMQNWELAAFEDVGVKDMAFDPEGNIVCGVNFGGEFSGFEHVPGFYAFWANRVGIADNGIVYKTAMTMYNNAVLAYSLDHGEHFYNTIENLPLSEPIPGGDDGFLSKGHDNHLYFLGNDQYWKSIPNANDIPNVISFPSEWYYEIQNENGSITYQYMYQANDTIINDDTVHILVKINTLYDKGVHEDITHEYVYMRDGKVYWWNKTLEEFTVLYDFGAQEGDTWVTKVGTETLIMHVNSEETVEYEGKTYRMLHVSDVDDYFSGDIVCGIGHLTSFFPERLMNNGDRMRVEGLRCYWIDEELVLTYGDEDCDAIISEIHNVEENGPSTGSGTLTIYPNPTDGVLFVEMHGRASQSNQIYRITNLMGQTVLSGSITAETQQIDVSALPEGMYFITFAGETLKFVVNK